MAKKATVAKAATETKKTTAQDGVFIYIGPSIRGLIQKGSIYRGTRESVLASLEFAIKEHPKIERLIVADNEIVSAKRKIAVGGNSLSNAYRVLSDIKN